MFSKVPARPQAVRRPHPYDDEIGRYPAQKAEQHGLHETPRSLQLEFGAGISMRPKMAGMSLVQCER